MRKTYLDWIRVTAIALVIFNHLPAYAEGTAYGEGLGFSQVFCSLVHMNVPLLFMISGSLLLGREESVRVILRKRVSRFAACLIVFSAGLYLLRQLHETVLHGAPFAVSLPEVIYGTANNTLAPLDSGSYWYLYAYLGFLLMLPFLQSCAAAMKKEHFLLLVILHGIIFAGLPLINLVLSGAGQGAVTFSPDFSVPLATVRVFFFSLAGYYLDHHVQIEKMGGRHIWLLLLTALGSAAACSLLRDALGDHAKTMTEGAAAVCIFLLAKRLICVSCPRLGQGRTAQIMAVISGLSFGIYLLDPYLKLVLFGAYYRAASPILSSVPLSILWVMISMAVGGAITWGLQHIPGVRWLLGGPARRGSAGEKAGERN